MTLLSNKFKELTSKEMGNVIFDDPASSYWLINAMEKVADRDVLDAAFDAEILALYARKRLEEVQSNANQ